MQGRSGRWWYAAGVIGVIAVLGVVLSVAGVFGGEDKPTAVAVPQASTAEVEPSVCGLTDVQLTGTVDTAPSPSTWSMVGTIATPAVDGQGPAVIDDDGFRSCFAHTPTGAVIAAMNLAALGSYPPVRERFYAEAIAPGPGRDALVAEPIPQGSTDGIRLELAGFQLLRYTGEQADLDLALVLNTGQLLAFTAYLEWAEGDWKIRVADDGSELSSMSPISSLGNYVPWSAESG